MVSIEALEILIEDVAIGGLTDKGETPLEGSHAAGHPRTRHAASPATIEPADETKAEPIRRSGGVVAGRPSARTPRRRRCAGGSGRDSDGAGSSFGFALFSASGGPTSASILAPPPLHASVRPRRRRSGSSSPPARRWRHLGGRDAGGSGAGGPAPGDDADGTATLAIG